MLCRFASWRTVAVDGLTGLWTFQPGLSILGLGDQATVALQACIFEVVLHLVMVVCPIAPVSPKFWWLETNSLVLRRWNTVGFRSSFKDGGLLGIVESSKPSRPQRPLSIGSIPAWHNVWSTLGLTVSSDLRVEPLRGLCMHLGNSHSGCAFWQDSKGLLQVLLCRIKSYKGFSWRSSYAKEAYEQHASEAARLPEFTIFTVKRGRVSQGWTRVAKQIFSHLSMGEVCFCHDKQER